MAFDKNVLDIDAAAETERIVSFLKESVQKRLRRHGAVVGISGGVDSAVVLALCVEAFGPKKVVAVMMPEKDSSPESETLARALAAQFGVEPVREGRPRTAALEQRRRAAVRRVASPPVAPPREASLRAAMRRVASPPVAPPRAAMRRAASPPVAPPPEAQRAATLPAVRRSAASPRASRPLAAPPW